MKETLLKLQAANPDLGLLSISAPEFRRYGRVLTRYDATEVIERAKRILPETRGIVYETSVAALEKTAAFSRGVAREVYGGMPVQVGWCYGQNLQMAALEYHKGTEINVCLTDVILLVGHVQGITYGDKVSYDTNRVAAFYAPEGTVVELPPWNLHFAPIHVHKGGSFATLVYLPKGTNESLPYCVEKAEESRLLFAVNKWLIAHPDATELIEQGAYPGLVGDDIYVKAI